MRNLLSILFVLLISLQFSKAQLKKVKVDDIVYMVDLYSKTAKVGKNYSLMKKGKVEGNVIIKPSIVYKKKEYPVTSYNEEVFSYCLINTLSLPNTIKTFNPENLGSSSLKEIIVSEDNPNFTTLNGVLYNKDMTEIIRFPKGKNDTLFLLPSSVLTIGYCSFSNCYGLRGIGIPNSVTVIQKNAFYSSRIKHIELPNSIETIEDEAFQFSSIKKIKLPYSLKKIGKNVFQYCSELESVVYQNKNLQFPSSSFDGCSKFSVSKIVYEAPLELLIDLAKQGKPENQYELANCYLTGEGKVEINKTKAIEWFTKASDQGHALSQKKLGDIYLGEKNTKEAIKYYTLASKNGSSDAQYILGNFYFYGKNVKLDYSKAFEYYKLSANQGNNRAEEALGTFYYFGYGKIKQDYKEAIHWFTLSAEKGNAMSAYYLATCYYDGLGCTKNDDLALSWSEKALAGEINEALPIFCTLAYADAVVKMNSAKYTAAISQFSKLLQYDSKHIDAFVNRGYCYLQLDKKDWASAEQDFKKALALDKTNEVAKNNLNVVNEHYRIVKEADALDKKANLYYIQKDYITAIIYCSKSISLYDESPYPYYLIGNCFNDNKLYADAIKFYNKALEVDPTYKLAKIAVKFAVAQQLIEAIANTVTAVNDLMNKTYTSNLSTTKTTNSQIPKSSSSYNSVSGASTFNCYSATREYETQRGYARSFINSLTELRQNDEIYGTLGSDYASRPNAALNISTANALYSIQNYMRIIRENAAKKGCVISKSIEENFK